jgi:hypothetical protein
MQMTGVNVDSPVPVEESGFIHGFSPRQAK